LGEESKEVMEDKIKGYIKDFQTTRIICKSGAATESFMLERASLETCRSIIINKDNDYDVIKAILAAVNYLKSKNADGGDIHITSMINHRENLDAAKNCRRGHGRGAVFQGRHIAHYRAHLPSTRPFPCADRFFLISKAPSSILKVSLSFPA
jgi:hypothetical protein